MAEDASATEGFICVAIAIFFFGTNYIPVKKFNMGDGMFFQWCLCCGIWIVGTVVGFVQGRPNFEPWAVLGGFFWASGNALVVPIVDCIGLGMGLLLWGTTNMLMGWSMGNFGLFGLNQAQADNTTLNYIGVAFGVLAIVAYSFVRPMEDEETVEEDAYKLMEDDGAGGSSSLAKNSVEDGGASDAGYPAAMSMHEEESGLRTRASSDDIGRSTRTGHHQVRAKGPINRPVKSVNSTSSDESDRKPASKQDDDDLPKYGLFTQNFTRTEKTMFGYLAAGFIGVLYAVNFAPPQNLLDNGKGSDDILDYVQSHFSGIFLTSTVYFAIYCAYKRSKPWVNTRTVLPGFVSGIMWGIAQTAWFVANNALEYTIAFPLVTVGPSFIAAFLGVFVFKEVQGKRNYVVLLCACSMLVVSVTCIAMSRD